MKKIPLFLSLCFTLVLLLSGCSLIGEKSSDLSIIYWITTVLSFLLLIGYVALIRPRNPWFLVLFSAVSVVNMGYLWLSLSATLSIALWANRFAYLGSVFLPLSIMMTIMNVTGLRKSPWLVRCLVVIALAVFFIAATPGFSDLYYREVSLITVGGVTMLDKVYGPLHSVYPVYLVGYFIAMIAVSIRAAIQKKMGSTVRTVILIIAVFVNLGVWLIEQLVHIDFEILSVSYIITELFLLGLHLVIYENEKLRSSTPAPVVENTQVPVAVETPSTCDFSAEDLTLFRSGLEELTRTERHIYELYVAGKTTKEVLEELEIKENTLKFHNKNLYGKLGVSSRKQLLEIHKKLSPEE